MRGTWLKRIGRLAFCSALSSVANAVEVLPAYLTGTWGTGASLYDGSDKQSEIYLLADGFGMAVGSTEAARRLDGANDGKPGPRAIIGFPVRATLNGDELIVRPFLPSGEQSEKAASMLLSCRYDPQGKKMACIGPDGVPMNMKRRSDSIPVEVARMVDAVRIRDH